MDSSLICCCVHVLCCLALPGLVCFAQFLCSVCNRPKAVRYKHGTMCNDCHHEQQQLQYHPPLPPSPSPSLSPPPSMFGRPEGCIDQLTFVERAAIVTLHQVGWT